MKRFYTLIVLLGLAMGMLTGCNKDDNGAGANANTNAAPTAPTAPAATSTNK